MSSDKMFMDICYFQTIYRGKQDPALNIWQYNWKQNPQRGLSGRLKFSLSEIEGRM